MADPDPKAELERRLAAAAAVAGRVGHAVLDAVEAALFGRVGGADEAVRKEEGRGGLDAVRGAWGQEPGPLPAPSPDPEARARVELERLKAEARERKEDPEAAVRKRTL